jgi:hypothetical protein
MPDKAPRVVMFKLDVAMRDPFDLQHIEAVPHQAGVYIIYDLAGPIYVGRSRVDINRRLRSHFKGTGNANIALARRVGASSSLTFTYCCLPPEEQADVERILIAALGVAKFANLRREGLYEDDL